MNKNSFFSLLLASACLLTSVGCGLRQADISVDTSAIVSSGVGELIEPPEDSEEAGLGSYRMSEDGIKLYYDDQQYSTEVVLALKDYFLSFENNDFDNYKRRLFPSYAEKMEKYLQDNYSYGLDHSFESQCNNLKKLADGDEYAITRIRVEAPELTSADGGSEGSDAASDPFADFFESLDSLFGTAYYDELKNECDSMDILKFSVMTKANGEEKIAISDYEIVFVEKDGEYYTFG